MTDLYIAKRGELIQFIGQDLHTPKPMTSQQRIDYVMAFNEDLGKGATVPQNNLILLNPDIRKHKSLNDEYQVLRKEFRSLPDSTFNGIAELGGDQTVIMLQAITDFLNDQNWYSHAGDLNGFSGAAVGAVTDRTSKFVDTLRNIERLLEQYGKAPSLEKARVKAQVRQAYESLNQRFGNILGKYFARAKANYAHHPVFSPRRAMKLANQGRYMTLTGTARGMQIMSGMKALNYVGKGMIALDLGFRARNIYRADNHLRQTVIEAAGLGGSFVVGYIGGGVAIGLALGPVGWLIAIVLIGATAVVADYTGRWIAGSGYDFVDTQFHPLPGIRRRSRRLAWYPVFGPCSGSGDIHPLT